MEVCNAHQRPSRFQHLLARVCPLTKIVCVSCAMHATLHCDVSCITLMDSHCGRIYKPFPLHSYRGRIVSKFREQFGTVQTAELHQHCTTKATFAVTNHTTGSTVLAAQCLIHSVFLLGVSLFSWMSDLC